MSDLMKTTKKTTLQAPKKNSAIQKKKVTFPKSANDILMLQRSVGNQAVQRLFESGFIQGKLTVGEPNDKYEQEADRVADAVMRMPESQVQRQSEEEEEEEMIQPKSIGEQITPLVQRQVEDEEEEEELLQAKAKGQTPQVIPNLESKINALQGGGQPLSKETRNFFEPRFRQDFSKVKIHTDSNANQLARSINARAFTRGSDIVFNGGEYSPESSSGKRLLGHELTHVVQQGGGGGIKKKCNNAQGVSLRGSAIVRRDLSAYNKPKQHVLPCYSMYCVPTYITISAEALGLRSALSALIASGKVKEIRSTSGNRSWFAANHHRNCKRSDIERALRVAGYSLARRMSRALYDIHGEYLYQKDKIVVHSLIGSFKKTKGPRLITQRSRSLTEFEIRQAKIVFKSALKYAKVTIEDGSMAARFMSLGGYARTVGNTIYFPAGKSRDMPFMIHELTHVWQYQKKGARYAIKCLWAQATEGYKYMPKGTKKPDQYMLRQRGRAKTLNSYNFEQQGDILADYYSRRRRGLPVFGYQLFAKDVK